MISLLMYHQIADIPEEYDPECLAITPDLFRQQMNILKARGFQNMSLSEAVRYWSEGRREPYKAFVLTFDDGYRDVLTNAQPILAEFEWTATVFIVAELMGKKSTWEGQRHYPLLSWDEARHLKRENLTFGSHTLTHPRLSTLSDEHARREIAESKHMIEDKLNVPIDFISYPYGDVNSRIQDIAQSCGYQAACGVNQGEWGLFNLWRATCERDEPSWMFRTKAHAWYRYRFKLRRNQVIRRSLRTVKRLLVRN